MREAAPFLGGETGRQRAGLARFGISRAAACAALFLAGLAVGAIADRYQIFPYSALRFQYHRWVAAREPSPDGAHADLSLITIQGAGDIADRRRGLVRLLWGADSLPSRLPDMVSLNYRDDRYADIPGLARMDRVDVRMAFGLDSRIFHFVPAQPNGILVLVHQGHGSVAGLRGLIGRLLERGYAVAALSMPLFGDNARPRIRFGQMGTIALSSHNQLRMINPAKGLREKYLIEPVPVLLNYLIPRFGYRSVAMVGLSGGGWTTTLAAAVDPRIARSFPVAGSLPLDLETGPRDFEQVDPDLYSHFSYLDLYLLGSGGSGRRQVQILNQFDPCCFAGRAAETYGSVLTEKAGHLGGGFDLLIDGTHDEHAISEWAVERILERLQGTMPREEEAARVTG